jgi:lauroyl/myristoyl acyltransferase
VGADQLAAIDATRGIVLVSLHYGLYSSMLIWWLAQATARNLFKRLTVLMRSNATGQYLLSSRRIEQFEAVGVWSRQVTLFDRTRLGPSGAARALLDRLGPREAILLFPDAVLHSATERALTVKLGRLELGLPRGATWLAQTSRCPVVPVNIRPHGDNAHAVVFGPANLPASPSNTTTRVNAAVQYLVDQTVMVDPSPWEGWLREGLVDLPSSRRS